MRSLVRVVTSLESAARDASAIAAGVPSRALMQRAGAAAAGEIVSRYRAELERGALVLAGPGNNGGDAWVVARALVVAGARVRVIEPVAAKTPDAIAERALALEVLDADAVTSGSVPEAFDAGEGVLIDGLLGTGARGAAHGPIADALAQARLMRIRGVINVALDIVSGFDATTGEGPHSEVFADLTLTFGTVKRAHLMKRGAFGTLVVLDIGLGRHAEIDDGAPLLIDEPWVAEHVPSIPATAHKGVKRKLAIVGGGPGMAGAVILAARAAARSGTGMVKLVVAPENLPIVQQSEPYALAAPWPTDAQTVDEQIVKWADTVVIGPGLGRTEPSQGVLDLVLSGWTGPTLLDADALTLFAGRLPDFAARLAGRRALITPHPAEFARLRDRDVEDVLAERFEIGREMAATLGAVVLLKGTPTVIFHPDGRRLVSATGNPALAAAGSGDILSGIAGTLLAQLDDPFVAAATGAWVHGRSAERTSVSPPARDTRGITLEDVIAELRAGWTFDTSPGRYPVLAELPNVGWS